MAANTEPKGAVTSNDQPLYDSDQVKHHDGPYDSAAEGSVQDELTYQFDDSRKLGITSSVFVILNKMIGTGIFSTPSGIFANTGSVGVSLFLWVIGGLLTFAGLSAFMEFGLAVRQLVRDIDVMANAVSDPQEWWREELPRARLPTPEAARDLRAHVADDLVGLLFRQLSCVRPILSICVRLRRRRWMASTRHRRRVRHVRGGRPLDRSEVGHQALQRLGRVQGLHPLIHRLLRLCSSGWAQESAKPQQLRQRVSVFRRRRLWPWWRV
jgi:hypothetical protein